MFPQEDIAYVSLSHKVSRVQAKDNEEGPKALQQGLKGQPITLHLYYLHVQIPCLVSMLNDG